MDIARRLESACTMAVPPDLQLLPTTISNDSAMDHVRQGTVRILKRLFPALFTGTKVQDVVVILAAAAVMTPKIAYPKYLPETAVD